jgi:hypothetical protein
MKGWCMAFAADSDGCLTNNPDSISGITVCYNIKNISMGTASYDYVCAQPTRSIHIFPTKKEAKKWRDKCFKLNKDDRKSDKYIFKHEDFMVIIAELKLKIT